MGASRRLLGWWKHWLTPSCLHPVPFFGGNSHRCLDSLQTPQGANAIFRGVAAPSPPSSCNVFLDKRCCDFWEEARFHVQIDTLVSFKLRHLDKEKAEVLNDFCASVFNGKCSSHTTEVRKSKCRDWENEDPKPTVGKDQEKAGDPGKNRPVSLIYALGKTMKKILLETVLRHMVNKEVIRNSQHNFTKGKSYLTNFITFYDGAAALLDRGRATGIIYLDSGKYLTLSRMISLSSNCHTVEGRDAIQRDLDLLERWANGNLRKFNKMKSKVLHLGPSNASHTYRVGREMIESSPVEKDLGVMVDEKT
ncbi:hypothetical protein WISP_14170 [Willisornis vidua]|uniref:Rna-directed dna polymerase from mobile element jockey-like n=1 Tax=Willisornis vidua TaxID=1566151 RepID=A0ABQ9DVT5_9PASS|nr:hypothetical protein WISP_14170 [Willisornis vidua]